MTYDYAAEIQDAREEAEREYGSVRLIAGTYFHENDIPNEDEL